MPLSLADRILSYRDVSRRGTTRKAPQVDSSCEPGPGAGDPGCAPDAARMRGLFGDVARDGSGLVEAVGGLKKALVESAVEQAIGAAGVRAAIEHEGGGRYVEEGQGETLPRRIEETP